MTQSVGLYEDSPPDGIVRPPRLPTFEAADEPAAASREPRAVADSARMGACLFIVADGVFFGSLFVVYATLHAAAPQIFLHGRYFLDARTGAIGNFILLASGLMAALSVRAASSGRVRSLAVRIAATLALAGLFLSVQAVEYAGMFEHRLLPGNHYRPPEPVWETAEFRREHPWAARYAARFRPSVAAAVPGPAKEATTVALEPLLRAGVLGEHAVYPGVPSEPRNAHLFFSLFFLFTGLHGLHVLGGAVAWAWLLLQTRRRERGRAGFGRVDGVALYWNLVALMRVFMFPLFYLVH